MTEAANPKKPELVHVQNLDHFMFLISHWHGQKVKVLEHMLSVPAGTAMQLGEGPDVTMEGDMLEGFKAGLGLALMELGQLPFVVDATEEPTKH